MIYLACPYTHPDPEIRFQRFQAVNKVAGDLMLKGEIVFSPISHGHPIAEVTDLPRNWGFWGRHCRAMIDRSRKILVLTLDGWKESEGVQAEIQYGRFILKPIEYHNIEREN